MKGEKTIDMARRSLRIVLLLEDVCSTESERMIFFGLRFHEVQFSATDYSRICNTKMNPQHLLQQLLPFPRYSVFMYITGIFQAFRNI